MTDLRIGIVGLGRMGGNHFNVWARLDGVRVLAIAEPDQARFREVVGAAEAEIDRHDDWQSLIARGDIDAISVVLPSTLHAEVAIAALDAGIHCLVEKPIATTVPEAMAMAAAAERAGKILTVGHVERFNPAARKLRALLADKESVQLGDVLDGDLRHALRNEDGRARGGMHGATARRREIGGRMPGTPGGHPPRRIRRCRR